MRDERSGAAPRQQKAPTTRAAIYTRARSRKNAQRRAPTDLVYGAARGAPRDRKEREQGRAPCGERHALPYSKREGCTKALSSKSPPPSSSVIDVALAFDGTVDWRARRGHATPPRREVAVRCAGNIICTITTLDTTSRSNIIINNNRHQRRCCHCHRHAIVRARHADRSKAEWKNRTTQQHHHHKYNAQQRKKITSSPSPSPTSYHDDVGTCTMSHNINTTICYIYQYHTITSR